MVVTDKKETAFERLEKMRKKAPDLDYEAELAAYREENSSVHWNGGI